MQAEDPLSRRPDHEEGVNFDNQEQILLKPEYFKIRAIEASHESMVNDDQILNEVKAALLSDEVTKNYKNLLKSGPREFGKSLEEWNYENGLLLYRGKVYIPKSTDDHLRRRIVKHPLYSLIRNLPAYLLAALSHTHTTPCGPTIIFSRELSTPNSQIKNPILLSELSDRVIGAQAKLRTFPRRDV